LITFDTEGLADVFNTASLLFSLLRLTGIMVNKAIIKTGMSKSIKGETLVSFFMMISYDEPNRIISIVELKCFIPND